MKVFGFWVSYDFGLKGDYNGLYSWLDERDAKECGNGVAFIKIIIKDENNFNSSRELQKIFDSMKKKINISKSDRIYLIWEDSETNRTKGRFFSGSRKQSPWEGYGNLKNSSDETDSAE